MHVLGQMIDRLDPRNHAGVPDAQGGRDLIRRRWTQGMADIGFDRRNGPVFDGKGLGHLIENMGFSNAILRRSSAMGHNEGFVHIFA